MSMVGLIYLLCALTALLCSWLLLKAYRSSRYKLLLWGGLCSAALTLNNTLLIVDKLLVPYIDYINVAFIISTCLIVGVFIRADMGFGMR